LADIRIESIMKSGNKIHNFTYCAVGLILVVFSCFYRFKNNHTNCCWIYTFVFKAFLRCLVWFFIAIWKWFSLLVTEPGSQLIKKTKNHKT